MKVINKAELLGSDGIIINMEYAYTYSADAVYAGQYRYSLRVREPDVPINLFVQANAVNWATVKFRQSINLTQVILS